MEQIEINGIVERVKSGSKRLMSTRQRGFLSRAVRIASTSTEKHRHGAVIVNSGRVISVGVNAEKVDPRTEGVDFDSFAVHAEESAIRAAAGNVKGATIYVARFHSPKINRRRFRFVSDSRPCDRCMNAIKEAGITTIVYTVGNGETIVREIERKEFG